MKNLIQLTLLFLLVAFASADRPPISIPRGCRNRCYRAYSRAFHDCRYRRRPVAGCHVTRCKVNKRRKRLGYICAPIASTPCRSATPQPSPSPSPVLPSPSKSPTSSPSVLPSASIPAESFTARTYRNGIRLADSRDEPSTDGSPVTYRVNYDMKMTDQGVVSLSGVSEFATVTCHTNGTVRISLENGVSTTTLSQMYPVGAVLIVDRDVFGRCKLDEDEVNRDETDDERAYREASDKADLFADGFLLIESVSGTPNEAIVEGSSTTFFTVFESATIRIIPVATSGNGTSRQLVPVSARAVNIDFDSSLLSIGPLALRVKGMGVSNGEFVSFSADWGLFSADIEFKFINQWTLNVDLDAVLSGGGAPTVKKWDLLSQALYGLPKINLLKQLGNDKFEFPALKLGFYFEVPLIVRAGGKIEQKVGNVATASYTTTRTEVTLFMKGPYILPNIGATTKALAPASKSFTFKPELTSNTPVEITFNAFAGIRPQFAAYALLFQARVSVEAGVDIEGKWDSSKDTAFPPLSGGGLKVGRCAQCHDVQILGKGKIQNAGIYASLGLDVKVKKFGRNFTIPLRKKIASIQLPGNPSVSVDIASGCFIEPKSDKGPLVYLREPNTCALCPENLPQYNPTTQECEEECPDPNKPFFNQATKECEACPPDTPVYNKKLQICEGTCPGGTRAGNDVPFYGSFELGRNNGTFQFSRTHFTIKDRMQVLYEGKTLLDTGCTGGSTTNMLSYAGTATNVVINVIPNCAGTTGTAWNFRVNCPS